MKLKQKLLIGFIVGMFFAAFVTFFVLKFFPQIEQPNPIVNQLKNQQQTISNIEFELDAIKKISDSDPLTPAGWKFTKTYLKQVEKSVQELKQDILDIKERISVLEIPKPKPIKYGLEDRVEQVSESVVHIRNETQGWQGSGVAITGDVILTARHVAEGGVDFTITLSDGTELKATRAISSKKYDLGFIKIDKSDPNYEPLKPAKLGSVEDCRLGQQVFAIGSPYGKLNFNSITLGIISGLNRDFDEWGVNRGYTEYGWSVTFTTDAAGHPGNSGCPVFTMDGRVRGILVGGFSPVLIYCVPVDLVAKDLTLIDIMFALDQYSFEEAQVYIWDGHNQSGE